MHKRTRAICSALFAFLSLQCALSTPAPRNAVPQRTAATQELTTFKAKIMSADYRADIDGLSRLRDEIAPLGNDPDLGYLAHYWSGFASWRMAINGANHDMKTEEQKANLQKAATEFYLSMRLKGDFADAYAAAAGVNSWLPVFSMGAEPDMIMVRERVALSRALLSHASALDPKNPRKLWIEAAPYLFMPEGQGGNIPRAIEIYRQMLEEADRRGVNAASPLPDWGKVEALMSLAYAHFTQKPADLRVASDEANAALKLQPDWSYVRDDLLPKIELERVRQDARSPVGAASF
jgi:hypothetical protein